ncbi:unnamed protein product [Darwinula stevensoni]|uniref:EGF-like domain-containing protein n=1 Tax=Darwinula stevensoni TaxID=69355 RepID=A0A7R9A3I2_9CRUS|nr:unnamed protein product [Darwinula stevensoni]CAG0887965.1 unnamed protein product [Darwinula stevensoni]
MPLYGPDTHSFPEPSPGEKVRETKTRFRCLTSNLNGRGQSVRVQECCRGYVANEKEECKPHCETPCEHGVCERPNTCKCDDGWRRKNCSSQCSKKRWGSGCRNNCTCENGRCDPVNGSCDCRAGWMGRNCETPCPSDSWGKGCQNHCDCRNGGTCNIFHGQCSCPTGYKGKKVCSRLLSISLKFACFTHSLSKRSKSCDLSRENAFVKDESFMMHMMLGITHVGHHPFSLSCLTAHVRISEASQLILLEDAGFLAVRDSVPPRPPREGLSRRMPVRERGDVFPRPWHLHLQTGMDGRAVRGSILSARSLWAELLEQVRLRVRQHRGLPPVDRPGGSTSGAPVLVRITLLAEIARASVRVGITPPAITSMGVVPVVQVSPREMFRSVHSPYGFHFVLFILSFFLIFAGYRGPLCGGKCRKGRYGKNCALKCNCKNNATCSHEDGKCICEPELPVSSLFYLAMTTGIVSRLPPTGDNCEVLSDKQKRNSRPVEILDSTSLGLIAGIAVALFSILVLAGLLFWIERRLHRVYNAPHSEYISRDFDG